MEFLTETRSQPIASRNKYQVNVLLLLYIIITTYSIFDQTNQNNKRNQKRSLLIKLFIPITAYLFHIIEKKINYGKALPIEFYAITFIIMFIEYIVSIFDQDSNLMTGKLEFYEIIYPVAVFSTYFFTKLITNNSYIHISVVIVTYLITNILMSLLYKNNYSYSECTFYSILLNDNEFCDEYILKIIYLINLVYTLMLVSLLLFVIYIIFT